MGNDVFANGRELSCKAGSGKSICCFPDVCFTPPQTPATPPGVPIPYPNTGMSSDTSKGSRDVKITKKEVMLKNKSAFKKSVGDQAGCAPKKGVVTSKTGGKVYFNAWSMDVKIEGENAVRHLDLTTHNHGSAPGNTLPWPHIDTMAFAKLGIDETVCDDDVEMEKVMCEDFAPYKEDGDDACTAAGLVDTKVSQDGVENMSRANKRAASDCLTARACRLLPKDPLKKQGKCCPGQTGHHLVEASAFFEEGGRDSDDFEKQLNIAWPGAEKKKDKKRYRSGKAPCVCVYGPNQGQGTHKIMHTFQGAANKRKQATGHDLEFTSGTRSDFPTVTYGEARASGCEAISKTFPDAACSEDCIAAQLDEYHKGQLGMDDTDRIRSIATGKTGPADVAQAEAEVARKFAPAAVPAPASTGLAAAGAV